jgi:HAD superfamily hydrolase (TIGR01509 family)
VTGDRRNPSIEAVLFDQDGTLLDSFEQHSRALIAALADFGFEPPPLGRIRRLMGLPGLEGVLAVGVPPVQARQVWLRWAEWEGRLSELVQPFPGVVFLLERLRAAGYQLGIVTSRSRISQDTTPAALELLPHVDLLVTRDDTSEGKPHPAPVLHAFQRLGVAPARGVYVGDTRFDVEAGHGAGCLTVLTTWDDADHVFPTELQPDFVVASPDELAALLLN